MTLYIHTLTSQGVIMSLGAHFQYEIQSSAFAVYGDLAARNCM